ncbi:MAG: ThiF family adenylyltransferase [Magnetococcus sp. DMHC-8]
MGERDGSMDGEWLERYSRPILLGEVGGRGQRRLNQATVGIVGAGMMGTPLTLYLAGAGLGHLVVMDTVRSVALCAAVHLLNPLVRTTALASPVDLPGLAGQMATWQLAVLAEDEPASRALCNLAALQTGQILLGGWRLADRYVIARVGRDPQAPCLACVVAAGGTVAAARHADPLLTDLGAGVVGSILAMETIRSLLDNTRNVWYSALSFCPGEGIYETMSVRKDPHCAVCQVTVRD